MLISLSEVSTVVPSRTSMSFTQTGDISVSESEYINYQTYYSIDNGATWTTDSPKIKQAGTYNIYTLYCFVDKGNDATDLVDGEITNVAPTSLAANGNFIIAVQTIVVED